ncbi:MAG TPA: AAA family ATPase, partial [Trebonia sp.]
MELFGRTAELNACGEALSSDRPRGAALITGPAGIGKTSLWRAVADAQAAAGTLVLRTTGASGARAPLGNLADLLDPVLDTALDLVPGPQASTLRAALGHAPAPAPVT